jgi:hypothetical protein
MAWETGNEIDPPTSWAKVIATFLKNIDSHHLWLLMGEMALTPMQLF